MLVEPRKVKRLSIIIPCYNESKSLPVLLKEFSSVIPGDDVELILVNNGSTDNTEQVLNDLIPCYPFTRVVNVSANQGYGFGIISGLRVAYGKYFCWTHADLQTESQDVIKALEIIENTHNPERVFVKGRRKDRPLFDNIFTIGMSIFETIYLGSLLNDINAQPNLFHRSFFHLWNNPPHDFSLDLYAFYMARKYRLNVVRFPVLFKKRMYGYSHWNLGWKSKWRFIVRTINFSVKLKKRLQ